MAAVSHARNVMLQTDTPRTLAVQLPSNYTSTGDHVGTLDGSAQTNFQNWQITLSSDGTLNNAGGGSITDLDYTNVSGTKPDADADNTQDILESAATEIAINSGNLFNIYGSGNAGVFIGAGGLFGKDAGGNTTFSIDASDGDVIFKGDIIGGANIDITGKAEFEGGSSPAGLLAAVNANISENANYGIIAKAGPGGAAIRGSTDNSTRDGIVGVSSAFGGVGVIGTNSAGGSGVECNGTLDVNGNADISGTLSISTQTISNLTAGAANSVAGANVTGTVANATNATNASNATNATNASNSNSLAGTAGSGWCRQLVTDSGTAAASSYGFVLTATVSGVRTRATGGRNVVIESFSDEHLKFDIKPETLGLNFLMKLKPITFQVKAKPGITYHGLGARATEAVLKRNKDSLCITHSDGIKGIDYNSMIGVLIKAVQELNEKVNELEVQLTEGNL